MLESMIQMMFSSDDGQPPIEEGKVKNEYQKSILNLSCADKLNTISDLVATLGQTNSGSEIDFDSKIEIEKKELAKKIILVIETHPTNCGMPQRQAYISKIGFALMNRKCLKEIAKFLKDADHRVVEIGAGSGYLSFLLKYYAGVNITATDKSPPHCGGSRSWLPFQTCLEFDTTKNKLDDAFPDCNAILVCWPKLYLKSLMDNLPANVTKIVTIGESIFDATDCLYIPDDENGVRVYEYNRRNEEDYLTSYPFREIKNNTKLPRFFSLFDRIRFYERY